MDINQSIISAGMTAGHQSVYLRWTKGEKKEHEAAFIYEINFRF